MRIVEAVTAEIDRFWEEVRRQWVERQAKIDASKHKKPDVQQTKPEIQPTKPAEAKEKVNPLRNHFRSLIGLITPKN